MIESLFNEIKELMERAQIDADNAEQTKGFMDPQRIAKAAQARAYEGVLQKISEKRSEVSAPNSIIRVD